MATSGLWNEVKPYEMSKDESVIVTMGYTPVELQEKKPWFMRTTLEEEGDHLCRHDR